MEKSELLETLLAGARKFEMGGHYMNSGGKDSIVKGDVIAGIPVPPDEWATDFLNPARKWPHYIFRVKGELITCAIRSYDPESSCFEVHGLNPGKDRYPDRVVYMDQIVELYYVKMITRSCRVEEEPEVKEITPIAQPKPAGRPREWYLSPEPRYQGTMIDIVEDIAGLSDSLGIRGISDAIDEAIQAVRWTVEEGGTDADIATRTMSNLSQIQSVVIRAITECESEKRLYALRA